MKVMYNAPGGAGGGGRGAALNEIGLRSEVQPLALLCTIFDR